MWARICLALISVVVLLTGCGSADSNTDSQTLSSETSVAQAVEYPDDPGDKLTVTVTESLEVAENPTTGNSERKTISGQQETEPESAGTGVESEASIQTIIQSQNQIVSTAEAAEQNNQSLQAVESETKAGTNQSAHAKQTAKTKTAETQTDTEVTTAPTEKQTPSSETEPSTMVAKDHGSSWTPKVSSQTETSKPEEETTAHVHQWTEITETAHHDAVTEEKWVVDTPAWTEEVITTVPVTEDVFIRVASCRMCGAAFESEDLDTAISSCHQHIIEVHDNACGYGLEKSYHTTRQSGTKQVTEYVNHAEEGHMETVTVRAAYDETVIVGYRCSCGETK